MIFGGGGVANVANVEVIIGFLEVVLSHMLQK